MTLATEDFELVTRVVQARSAIVIGPGKEYLVRSRLTALAKKEGIPLKELLGRLRAANAQIIAQVVDAMTTNETFFFRDEAVFRVLRTDFLPNILAKNRGPIRIYCAACSSGQEPYSVAMLIRDHFPREADRFQITASDISHEMILRAQNGVYSRLEVQRGLPARTLHAYFSKMGFQWQIDARIRNMVTFQRRNLLDAWTQVRAAHIIMLRNVLIYMGIETRKRALHQVRNSLAPHGILILGAQETTHGIDDRFEPSSVSGAGCFQLRQGGR